MLRKVELLMIILYYASLASFVPPSSGGLTMLLCIYIGDTCNKKSATNCGSA